MTTEDFLLLLSGIRFDLGKPIFGPILARKGIKALDEFTPKTQAERALVLRAAGLFNKPSPTDCVRFLEALHACYLEQGYSLNELAAFFG